MLGIVSCLVIHAHPIYIPWVSTGVAQHCWRNRATQTSGIYSKRSACRNINSIITCQIPVVTGSSHSHKIQRCLSEITIRCINIHIYSSTAVPLPSRVRRNATTGARPCAGYLTACSSSCCCCCRRCFWNDRYASIQEFPKKTPILSQFLQVKGL